MVWHTARADNGANRLFVIFAKNLVRKSMAHKCDGNSTWGLDRRAIGWPTSGRPNRMCRFLYRLLLCRQAIILLPQPDNPSANSPPYHPKYAHRDCSTVYIV